VNAKRHRWTPLHFAAKKGHVEAIKQHISYGTDYTIQNKNHSAIKILRKHGGKMGEELKAEVK
jgi:ankyrin repeat protein